MNQKTTSQNEQPKTVQVVRDVPIDKEAIHKSLKESLFKRTKRVRSILP